MIWLNHKRRSFNSVEEQTKLLTEKIKKKKTIYI